MARQDGKRMSHFTKVPTPRRKSPGENMDMYLPATVTFEPSFSFPVPFNIWVVVCLHDIHSFTLTALSLPLGSGPAAFVVLDNTMARLDGCSEPGPASSFAAPCRHVSWGGWGEVARSTHRPFSLQFPLCISSIVFRPGTTSLTLCCGCVVQSPVPFSRISSSRYSCHFRLYPHLKYCMDDCERSVFLTLLGLFSSFSLTKIYEWPNRRFKGTMFGCVVLKCEVYLVLIFLTDGLGGIFEALWFSISITSMSVFFSSTNRVTQNR